MTRGRALQQSVIEIVGQEVDDEEMVTDDGLWTIGDKKVGRKNPDQDSIFEPRSKSKKVS